MGEHDGEKLYKQKNTVAIIRRPKIHMSATGVVSRAGVHKCQEMIRAVLDPNSCERGTDVELHTRG